MAAEKSGPCLETGHCMAHGDEVERRKETVLEIKDLWRHVGANAVKIYGVAATMVLFGALLIGSFTYTNSVKFDLKDEVDEVRLGSDRGEEILLAKINANYTMTKRQQDEIMSNVVKLLTADAERREWQRGMMTQMKTLNEYIKSLIEHNRSQHEDGFYYDPRSTDEQ